jgi:hypothetical protein
MEKIQEFKTSWTWKEWQQSRPLRKAISAQVGPAITRRKKSSSDRRLRAAFAGHRAPA